MAFKHLPLLIRNTPQRLFQPQLKTVPVRHIAQRKRFYKKTGILQNDGHYEIILDQRKLKTPKGNMFSIKSEPLALAVAAEWDAQKLYILPSSMHLSGLCSTVIDNPNKFTKEAMVEELISFLEMDTILFHSQEADELYDLQSTEWSPVINWFSQKFQVDIQAVRSIEGPVLKPETRNTITKYFTSHDIWAVHGFKYVIEALKSVILAITCCDRHISVEKAVLLSRLEEEYQGKRWGHVEWAHGMNQQDLQARVAAGVLFIHANSSSILLKEKT